MKKKKKKKILRDLSELKMEDYKVVYSEGMMEMSHPDNKINSIINSEFLPYNYIEGLKKEIKELKDGMLTIRGHTSDQVVRKSIEQLINKEL